ncbi:retrovirus-related Pol polyprotein from transposon TNT 1-94 isoform X2 [Apium graveolens]|uniref:retrovirus-related Pol polyprotein from transposon TNT 1-94 isoform X2 n=1 Tax=Apium graveolens TaxID=4045 RepID=UPI003D7BC281
MGVKHLWDILDSCKKTLPLEHLRDKRVCIDLSCWIVQLQNVNKSHCSIKDKVYLRGLFHRLRALLALNCTIILVAARMEAYLEANDLWEPVEEDYELPALANNPTMAQMKHHKERKTKKSKARAVLFSAVSSDIFTRIMTMKTSFEIWNFLKSEYEGDERIKGMQVLNLVREFEMQRMRESETIKVYSDRLLGIANKVKLLGTDFPDSRIVQKILVTLPEKFEVTISALENSKDLSTITLAELLNALKAQEQRRLMRQEGTVEGAYQAKSFSKDGGKNRNWQNKNKPGGFASIESNQNNNAQVFPPCSYCKKTNHPPNRCWWRPDVKCHKCGQLGHMEKICKSQQVEAKTAENQYQDEEQLFVASCFSAHNSTKRWLIDSGCTNHMTYDRELFKDLNEAIVSKVRVGNGAYIAVKGKGTVEIQCNTGLKLISDVLYVPDIDQNLLSVSQLTEKGYKVLFDDNQCVIKDAKGVDIFKAQMKGKTFALDLTKLEQTDVHEEEAFVHKEDNTMLWHKRLGHFHHAAILFMEKNNMARGLPALGEEPPKCVACQYGKQSRLPFQQNSAWRATEKLQLIHTDVAGPMSTPSLNGSKYYIAFIDDYSRMCWIYFMKQKSEVADIFATFKAWVETQTSSKIIMIRSDNGTEYTSEKFNKFCRDAGIEHQLTAPYTPQQNGVVERKNRTIMEMARCLLHDKGLPKKFWAEAANTAVFLLNRLPTKALIKRDKLDKKSDVGIFVGYTSNAYRIYQPQSNKIVTSRDVYFLESESWKWENEKQVEIQEENENVDDEPVKGTRLLSEIYQKCNVALMEPAGYEAAATDQKWIDAMKEELKMIEKNQTWELVDRPKHKKAIGVKWVYRTKFNPDGSINKYKARLVVKGYAQIYGVDFSETFAPVARMETIRMLLALAAQKGWTVHQMDVKSAFLNGVLEEEIFVEQPEGFVCKGQEDKVYRLIKALYGCRQAPRTWYSRIDTHLLSLGFVKSLSEATLYVKKSDFEILVVSLYVDDLLVTGSNLKQIDNFKEEMKAAFEMTDLGKMTFFLGMEVQQNTNEIFICQKKYAKEILKKFNMDECKPTTTPMNNKEKFYEKDGAPKTDEGLYRSLIGCLMYLTITRPDIMNAVSILSRYMHCASEIHFQAGKRILRYVKGTIDYGVKFSKVENFRLHGYADSDLAGCEDDMKSTLGYCFSFGSGMFSWSSKKQEITAQSTAEAEFIAAVAAANQALWLRKLMMDLHMNQQEGTIIFVDNQSAISIADKPVFHDKTKHFKIKFYFLREVQSEGEVQLIHCSSENQTADILTKALSKSRYEFLRHKLGVCSSRVKEEC